MGRMHYLHELDEVDQGLVRERMSLYRLQPALRPRVGEIVDFPGQRGHRFSHDWVDGMQTSPGGSFHLDRLGGMSFSGGLDSYISDRHFTLTDEVREADAWIFHHGIAGAGRGVDFVVEFRVWTCDIPRDWRETTHHCSFNCDWPVKR